MAALPIRTWSRQCADQRSVVAARPTVSPPLVPLVLRAPSASVISPSSISRNIVRNVSCFAHRLFDVGYRRLILTLGPGGASLDLVTLDITSLHGAASGSVIAGPDVTGLSCIWHDLGFNADRTGLNCSTMCQPKRLHCACGHDRKSPP